MFGQAEISLSENYFRESYVEWFRHVARWRKWQIPVAIVAALAIVPAWLFGLRLVAFVLAALSGMQVADAILHRRKWIADRLRSSRLNETVSITFSDDGMEFSGPYSSGKMAWGGVNSWVVTDSGVFLRPDTGVSIYVPKETITPPEAVGQIVAHLEQAKSVAKSKMQTELVQNLKGGESVQS